MAKADDHAGIYAGEAMNHKLPESATTGGNTPPCDCGYKDCDGTTVLNGVRFTCSEGQYTYEHHIDNWPVYEAAPELLEALKEAQDALLLYDGHSSSPGNIKGWTEKTAYRAYMTAEAAIRKANGKR